MLSMGIWVSKPQVLCFRKEIHEVKMKRARNGQPSSAAPSNENSKNSNVWANTWENQLQENPKDGRRFKGINGRTYYSVKKYGTWKIGL